MRPELMVFSAPATQVVGTTAATPVQAFPDAQATVQFLRWWFPPDVQFVLTAIPANGGKPVSTIFNPGDYETATEWAHKANAVGTNVYFGCNAGTDLNGTGKLAKSEITHILGV